MKWINIKDQWPASNSEVIVYYFFNVNDILEDEKEYGKWTVDLIHEKHIQEIESSQEIFWTYPPKINGEKNV